MGWEDEGQFTGEISPLMLKEGGVRVVEIGHSERRHILHEDDEMINHSTCSTGTHGFIPCCALARRQNRRKMELLTRFRKMQIKLGLRDVKQEDAGKIWIAYEPVWAIGVKRKPVGWSMLPDVIT